MPVVHSLIEDTEVRTITGEVVPIRAGMLTLTVKGDTYDALLPTGETVTGLLRGDIDALKATGKLA